MLNKLQILYKDDMNHDIAIIGAGPIGIELAAELKRLKIDYVHLEAGPIGSTINWYAPGTHFFSSAERIAISGVPLETANQQKPTREEYLSYLRSVVRQFDLKIETFQKVSDIVSETNGFKLKVSSSPQGVGGPQSELLEKPSTALFTRKISAQKIILAIGDMHLPNLIEVPGEELPHVSHYLKEPHLYFGKDVLIVGGKNSAVEAAIRLYRIGAKVSLCYRGRALDKDRIKYWLFPELEWLIKKKFIRFYPSTTVIELKRTQALLQQEEDESFLVPCDFVLLLTGYRQDTSLFERAGVILEGPGRVPVYNRATMETNVPGLFVAGTAAAGTQSSGVKEFIETSHIHVNKIVSAITGRKPPDEILPDESSLES